MTRHRRFLTTLLATSLLLATASCSASGGDDVSSGSSSGTGTNTSAVDGTTSTRPTSTTQSSNDDATCPSEADVGDVVGAEVDQSFTTGGRGGTGTSYQWEGCAYHWDDNAHEVAVDRLAPFDGSNGTPTTTTQPGDIAEPLFDALATEAKDSSYVELTVEENAAFDTGDELVVDDEVDGESRPIRVTTDEVEGTPEELARLRVELAELVV